MQGNRIECYMSALSGNTNFVDNLGFRCPEEFNSNRLMSSSPQSVFNYCTGAGDTTLSWLSNWYGKNSCTSMVYYQLGVSPEFGELCFPKQISASSDVILYLRFLMNAVILKYREDGLEIPAEPGTETYTTLQDIIYGIYCDFPILGQQNLPLICKDYTAEQVARNPYLIGLCGCYLSPSEYQDFVPPECSTICNNNVAVKRTNTVNNYIQCPSDVCVINGVSIAVQDSTTGEININQVCGSCSGNCNCYIDGNDINAINSVTGDININEFCGTITCANGEICSNNKRSNKIILSVVMIIVLVVSIVISIMILRRLDRQ